MSKILTKMVKKAKLISIILAAVLTAAIAVGVICGLTGSGVFNKSALLEDSNTLSVSMNHYVYQTKLDEVEDVCEDAFADLKVSYMMKGEMSGDESEIVYVFDKDADLSAAKAALEAKFEQMKANEWKDILVFITVSTNSETAIAYLAEYYVLGGVFAGVALAALVFAYVAIRYGLNKGVVAAISTAAGVLMAAALIILTRIPVTASVSYVLAAAGLMAAVATIFTLNKIRTNEKAENATEKSADMIVEESIAEKELLLFCAIACASLVILGAIATAAVRWFAILSIIAVIVATFMGLVYAPALYLPLKKVADNKPAKDAYVGAVKTSTKEKKVFVKKSKAAPVEEPAEEVAETTEEVVEEVTAEETVEETTEEETVEETVAEEVVEETTEEVAEEPAQEPTADDAE